MITIRQYAEQNQLSDRTARKQLDRMVLLGKLVKEKRTSNFYTYYEPRQDVRWHDPFNRTLARQIARPVVEVPEPVKKKSMEKPQKVSKPKALALDATAIAHTASLQHWFKHIRGRNNDADNSRNIAQAPGQDLLQVQRP